MNHPDTEIVKKGIVVIESLPSGERKTGEELHQDRLRYKSYIREDIFSKYYAINSKTEFISILKKIAIEIKKGEIFTLHFETHGNEEGVSLKSGEVVLWKDFYDLTRPINEKMGHLLIIVMAMCKGGALVSYIDIKKRAPYFAFIGAFKDVTVDVIARGFGAFYEHYNSLIDITPAFNALCTEVDGHLKPNESRTFWIMTAENVLSHTFNLDRDPVFFHYLVSQLFDRELANGRLISIPAIEEKVRRDMHEDYIQYKDYYCFKDLYGH